MRTAKPSLGFKCNKHFPCSMKIVHLEPGALPDHAGRMDKGLSGIRNDWDNLVLGRMGTNEVRWQRKKKKEENEVLG